MSFHGFTTVFYSRKTLVLWVVAVSAVLIAVFGYFLVSAKNRRVREIAGLRTQIRTLKEEGVQLRVANQMLKIQAAKQRARIEQKLPPPELHVTEHIFPVGKAIAVIPGRLFVTLARLDGERARIRIAAIREGSKGNRSRTLAPGQTWRFRVEKKSYALVFHARKSRPPGAHLSIRRLDP